MAIILICALSSAVADGLAPTYVALKPPLTIGLGDAGQHGVFVSKSLSLCGSNLACVIFRAKPQDYPSWDVGLLGRSPGSVGYSRHPGDGVDWGWWVSVDSVDKGTLPSFCKSAHKFCSANGWKIQLRPPWTLGCKHNLYSLWIWLLRLVLDHS
jgi:hypothetical protein